MTPKDTKKHHEDTVDWTQLKADFFKDTEETVAGFLRKKLGIKKPTTTEKRRTKGWAEEKKEFMTKTLEWAKTNLQNKISEAYEVPIEQLNNLKKGIFDVLLARLSQITQKVKMEIDPATGKKTLVVMGDIPTKELVDILKVVKTELGEATNINQAQLGDEEKKIAREIGSIKII